MVFCFKLCCLLSFTRLKLSLNKCCSMRLRVFDMVYYTSLSDFGQCLYKINATEVMITCSVDFWSFFLKLISGIFFYFYFRMSSSCIHVTALLFWVEAANRNGLTNPACTSCTWNVPQQSLKVKPTKICDIN